MLPGAWWRERGGLAGSGNAGASLAPLNAAQGPLKTKDKHINGKGESMNRETVRTKSYKTILALAGAAIIAGMPVAAEADPLGLTVSWPDITSQEITGDLASGFSGTASSFFDGTNSYSITGGSFDLDYILGTIALKGAFSYGGTDYAGDLLTGTITAEGDNGFSVYEFLFTVDSGSAALLFGGIGATGGTSIYSLFGVQADTFFQQAAPVPEPATMSLMLLGGSALVAIRRRKNATT